MTPEEFDRALAVIAELATQMIEICDRIIDTVDERSAVRMWNAELGEQLEAIARAHQELHR